jgi:serine/threonine protein kinase
VVILAGMEPVPGHVLTRRLGTGGFGEVWEAVKADGSSIALKFQDMRSRKSMQIQSEIRVLNGLRELSHPNIIQFHGVHANSHYLILSMERADGSLLDLRHAYQEEGLKNIPTEHALDLLEQAADALDFLVDQKLECFNAASPGLQHCDVKPSNLLLVGDTLKVADFGLCASTSWQTHRNAWRGTLPYAAPELYRGKASVHTDQYALAVTFCELSIGPRCFFPLDPKPGPPKMPIDLTKLRENEYRIISRALAPNWTDRWPSCRTFLRALRTATRMPRSSTRVKSVRQGSVPAPVPPCSASFRAIQ